MQLIYNLFGDGRPANIWELQNVMGMPFQGKIYIAVAQNPDGTFQVARIHSKPPYPEAHTLEIDPRELTGDGQPELVVLEEWCEASCFLQGFIYQWQEGRFVDISRGNYVSEDKGELFSWEYGDRGAHGSTTINIAPLFAEQFNLHRQLSWNGQWFQVGDRAFELPSSSTLAADHFTSWIGYAMEYAEFDGIEALFQDMLADPPADQGPAFPDFVNFQRAMVEALSSRVKPSA